MVSLCLLIHLIGVCADRDQPEFLCSRSDSRCLKVHVATAGGWLTRYRPREVRNSIYRYRKIHIDYRSKFLYRFISSISIIYGNTSAKQVNPSWWIGKSQPQALSYNSELTLSQSFQPMAAQLSKKAALPLAKILVTGSCQNSTSNGSWRQGIKGEMTCTGYVA